MRWRRTLGKLAAIFRRGRVERELEEEVRAHLEMEEEENRAAGREREEARYAARRAFGNVTRAKEMSREMWLYRWAEDFFQDVRYALRTLGKSPGFAAVAVLTLALGTGANTAIFSAVYAVLLKALPFPEPDRLVMVWEDVRLPNYQNEQNEVTPGNFAEWRSQNTVFEDMGAYRNRSYNLTGSGEPVRVEGELVTSGLFSVLRENAAIGRVFTADEDQPGSGHVAVMSEGLWKSRFGGDAQILGKTILLDGVSYTVIGVMPPGFHFPDPDDQLWVPMALSQQELNNRGSHYLDIVARLKAGVTTARAQAEMNTIARHLTEMYPTTNAGQTVNVVPLHEEIAGPVRPTLLALLGAVGLVLVIVCANVANLLLGRASVRHREMGIRWALGAGRTRILRQLLTESVLLALLGCALGLLLARWGVAALKLLSPPHIPRLEEISLNGPVHAFSLGISVFAGLIFGLAPALEAVRGKVHDSLKEGARESAGGARMRTRNTLVVMETALGVMVVIGAGLLLRSFLLMERTSLGFQPKNVLTFRVIPRGERYAKPSGRSAFYQQAIQRIEALPGVKSAAAITFIPLTFVRGSKGFTIEGRVPPAPGQVLMAGYDVVSPGYFETMQIPVLEGRDFSWSDTPQTQPVIVINEAMARRDWPGEDPLGKRIRQGGPEEEFPWMTIVGVVGDIREFDVMTQPRPTMYFPITQWPDSYHVLRDWVVRTAGNPLGIAAVIRGAIWDVDKDLPISRVRSMEQVRSLSVAPQRFNLLLFALFAALALALAAVGIYGVMAYSVAQRTREIGIRVALGAQHGDILRLVVAQGARLAVLGVMIGLGGAFALTRLMAGLLYGVPPTDPLTFAGVAALLAGAALLACYIPARRATRVDPIVALRHE